MANTIKQKRGTTNPSASDLVVGELAINTTDGGLFTKTDGGTIVEIGLDADTVDGIEGSNLMTLDGTQTITGAKDFDGTVTYDLLNGPNTSTRDKVRVYTGSSYVIGMQSGITFGGLSDWGMTFQFNDANDRGFWWGDTGHSTAQGAMALTTNGKLTVAHSVRIGYGESDTTIPGATHELDVSGQIHTSTGILFNNDTAAANTLDDYEEGSWTPVFAGATTAGTYTYGTQIGKYTKIGNKVTVWCELLNISTSSAGSGASTITGLPFASGGGVDSIGSVLFDKFDLTSSSIRGIHSRITDTESRVSLRVTRDGLTDTNIPVTDKVNNGSDIIFCITYPVS